MRPIRVAVPLLFVSLCGGLLASGCGGKTGLRTKIPIVSSAELCKDPTMKADAFCMPADRLEHMLRFSPMSVLQANRTATGTSGAYRLYVEFPDEKLTMKAKWKEAGSNGTALNNEPRKEIAAYFIQKLYLGPEEYVVPPTVTRCIPIDYYKLEVREPKHITFKNTECILGTLAYWLENIVELEGQGKKRFDDALFATNPAYATTVANMNILTYLIDHRDTRRGNFMISKDTANPRAIAIDNGLAFSGLSNPRTLILREWKDIIVPKLPRASIERLRKVTRADLDKLAVVAQFKVVGKQLEPGEPTESLPDTDDAVRHKDDLIQLGLTKSEIDGIDERLKALIKRADEGKIELF